MHTPTHPHGSNCMLVSLPGVAAACGELCYMAYGTGMAHATKNIQTKKKLCCVTVVMLSSWFMRSWKQELALTLCCDVAIVPACVSEWTAVSHTPGYTPPSGTSPACARNPSLPVDAASTGGTWSVSVWHHQQIILLFTWVISQDTIYYCCYISSALLSSNQTHIQQHGMFHPAAWRTKAIHQEQDVNWLSICACVECTVCVRVCVILK